jgi:hypothetical protein
VKYCSGSLSIRSGCRRTVDGSLRSERLALA